MNQVVKKKTFKEKLRSVGCVIENKLAPIVVGASTAIGAVCVSAFAESGAGQVGTIVLSEINSKDVLSNMLPFVNAAIPILAVVGGVKLGRNFLRSAFH